MGKCCRELKMLGEGKAQLSTENCFVHCKMGKKEADTEEAFPGGKIQFIDRGFS